MLLQYKNFKRISIDIAEKQNGYHQHKRTQTVINAARQRTCYLYTAAFIIHAVTTVPIFGDKKACVKISDRKKKLVLKRN